jgi:epoxide hydrolase 4
VPALAKAGFKVIVPDMRGYGRSDKPTGVEAYTMDLLVGDVQGSIAAVGADRAHIVGHDWGAGVAWATALMAAERVERLVALSVGHPATFFAGTE